jgi:hypothetical protein
MRTSFKYATALALAGALTTATASPSQAHDGRNAAAIGGFAAGAIVGAAAASANNGYYGPGYAYEPVYAPGYAYEPGYAYDYAPGYAYDPGIQADYAGYASTRRGYYQRNYNDSNRHCGVSPASPQAGICTP